MATVVEIPGIGEVEFPDDMSEEQIREQVAGMVQQPETDTSEAGTLETIGEFGIRRFADNFLNLPKLAGETLALGAAGLQTVGRFGANAIRGEELTPVQNFQQFLQQQRQQQPAAGLKAIPTPDSQDIVAGTQALAGGPLGGTEQPTADTFQQRFAAAQQADQERLQQIREQRPIAAGTGEVAGDIATIATGRAPFARAKAPKLRARRQQARRDVGKINVDASIKAELDDVISQKIVPLFKSVGKTSARGAGRAGQATLEGASLAVLNEDDPFVPAAFAAGAQGAGSLGLFLATKPIKRLLPTVAAAWAASELFKTFAPGDQNFFESKDFAFRKVAAALALGAAGSITGAGRLRGAKAEKFPALFDLITTTPRTTMNSLFQELRRAEEDNNDLPLKVMETLGENPTAFNENQRNALVRAMKSEKEGAFTREIERLRKNSDEFRKALDRLQ